ncbi:type I-E CRISPR-associated endonuclease Cas1e [Dethiosulfovibrio faecalis]|uniref:type I-E CRISPR-associated endonuclease Cas1e n=1 Tax=Dethiosulfovibrio faecalis TaxID=2720018 RepID=UPI00210648A9|nr:type I-E CRISPR-associated endonuclease Cas1e [Dethiosulfovibrio faecalis]
MSFYRPLPKLSPIPIKDRSSLAFVERGMVDVRDGTFVVVDGTGVRTHIPVGGICCIMLEPGARISHAAVALAARVGTLLIWIGEAGVRLYGAGQPGGARADRLLYQASLALNDEARLRVVRKMYELRFNAPCNPNHSVDQLRGVEGGRVKTLYKQLAKRYGVKWDGRRYDHRNASAADSSNRCLSSATACLYGVCEAAILAAGYSPAIGFIHTGKPRSFVFDVADVFKFETVVPVAFRIAGQNPEDPEGEVRRACRDIFRQTKILKRLIPSIEDMLSAGGLPVPPPPEEAMGPAFEEEKGLGDVGHRG